MKGRILILRTGIVVPLVALLALVAMASTSGAGSPKSELANKAMLLSVGQPPTGWSVSTSPTDSSVGCFGAFMEPKSMKRTSVAKVGFVDNGNLPELAEEIATYSKTSSAAFLAATASLTACPKFSGTTGGEKVKGTVGQMSFPSFGNQSEAFTVTLSIGGETAVQDLLIVRKGTYLIAIEDGDLFSPDTGQFEGFVKLALAKVP
jgi:hypothetical protein